MNFPRRAVLSPQLCNEGKTKSCAPSSSQVLLKPNHRSAELLLPFAQTDIYSKDERHSEKILGIKK